MFNSLPYSRNQLGKADLLKVYQQPIPWLPQAGTFSVAGVDLGQACDHATACVLERMVYDGDFVGPRDARCRLTYCRRWPNDTDYVELADELLALNPSVIVPEFNGVGRPVVDILRRRAMQVGYQGAILPIVTAASNARMQEHRETRGKHLTVPKVDIVSSIKILSKARLLLLPSPQRMPELKNLADEMRVFQMRYSKAGNQTFGNEPGAGAHDDLVIATGLACFFMLKIHNQREPSIYVG